MSAFRFCAFLAAAAALFCAPALALNTDGRLKGPLDPPNDPAGYLVGVSSAPMGIQRQGASSTGTYGNGLTFSSEPVGYWGFDVLSGTYAIGVGHKDQFPRMFVFGVAAGTTYLRIRENPDYYPVGFDYYPSPAQEFVQSFEALGTSVTSVSVKFATSQTANATIHSVSIDPQRNQTIGAQIGPARVLQGSFSNDSMATWSAGEVPTVPGQYYAVKFRRSDGNNFQVYYCRVRDFGGEAFPGGRQWYGATQTADALKTVIGMDTDGATSTMNTSIANSQITFQGVTVAGQTFTANGTSLIGVHFLAGNVAAQPDMEVALFQSPGSGGMGANQVGPSKFVRAIDNNGRTVATWFPGEAPLTPGQQYYVRIKRVYSNTGFAIWRTTTDEYAGGQAYIDGAAQNYDLSGLIALETSPGSATMQPVSVSTPIVTARTPSSATVSWSTDVPSTATIQYGSTTPYTSSVNDSNSTTSHSVTLTGLSAATEYHFRVVASASGKRTARSKDQTFVTETTAPNLLANPGFETGSLSPWVGYGSDAPGINNGQGLGGLGPRTGSKYAGRAYGAGGRRSYTGMYQTASVQPGLPVTFRAWLYTYQLDGFDRPYDMMVAGRVGIDPTGGTNPGSFSVIWSPLSASQDWFDVYSRPSRYHDLTVRTAPTGSTVTVFMEAGQINLPGSGVNSGSIAYVISGWDDAYLSQTAPQQLSRLGDVKALPDGTSVSIPDLVVTASSTQLGANYVEAADRSNGIRVESDSVFALGSRVTVAGVLSTKQSGERYIANGTLSSSVAGAELTSLGAKNAALGDLGGDSTGPGNVGMLMRTWGTVVSGGGTTFYLTDGSPTGDLRVDLPTGVLPPVAGTQVEVTGIVRLQGNSPETATIRLKVRQASDVKPL
ncbi:MAG: fibronectin type III domain-containing protein [Armatimonadetes bacterium]|nr:fibronectin type III domain-containing protein [Armatimonadota bacterium]